MSPLSTVLEHFDCALQVSFAFSVLFVASDDFVQSFWSRLCRSAHPHACYMLLRRFPSLPHRLCTEFSR